MRFENHNVLVTGSAAGLGRVVAEKFAAEGARLIVVDVQAGDETVSAIQEQGGRADAIRCDVRREEDVTQMAEEALRLTDGRIDVLVNNAAINGYYHLIQEMKLEDWENTLRTNLTGTLLIARAIVPGMIEREAGRIVNLASNVARRGLPYRADYVCSKWAILGFTQTLALELVAHGIRVNAVCPGPIEGDRIEQVMAQHARVEGRAVADIRREWEQAAPMKRFIEPEEVADIILFLASDASSAMTGQGLNATGGFIMT